MADLRNECCLDCNSGKISKSLSLDVCPDGRCLVHSFALTGFGSDSSPSEPGSGSDLRAEHNFFSDSPNVNIPNSSNPNASQVVAAATAKIVAPRASKPVRPCRRRRPKKASAFFISHFQDAIAYARGAQFREEYVKFAQKQRTTTLEVATADFFHPPDIGQIDVSQYFGQPGDIIRVSVVDNVSVASVGILIVDAKHRLIEMGAAQHESGELWSYTATKQAGTNHVKVIVDAADLPGHLSEKRVEKQV